VSACAYLNFKGPSTPTGNVLPVFDFYIIRLVAEN